MRSSATHEIKAVSADEARCFWEQQDDARIFLHPDVLTPLCERVDWWLATRNGHPVCLWPICHAFDGSHRPPELSAYVGPLWHDAVGRNKAHRWWTITRTVQQAFLDLFAGTYDSFEFELPPGSNDVRVFQWFRDQRSDSLLLEIECRHTAVIRSTGEAFPENVISGFSRDRRKDLIFTQSNAPMPCDNHCNDQLYDLYERLLAGKASMHVAKRRRSEIISLLEVAKSGFGEILAYRDQDGSAAGFSLSLFSKKTASLVVIAASEKTRSSGMLVWLRMQAIIANSKHGADSFDFLGANSLIGADEKHRYGAWPSLYFRISVSAK